MRLTEFLALFQAVNANVGEKERIGSMVSGVTLIVNGWRRRSALGYIGALLGLYFFLRGLTGFCIGYNGLGINRCDRNQVDSH